MTKAALISHIVHKHPEMIWPDATGLRAWRKEELEQSHAGMHRVEHDHSHAA